MMNPDDDLLTTTEGVDEGSAASTVEGVGSGASPAAGRVAEAPTVEGQAPAPPMDVETDGTRAARTAAPGQQLEAGEG